MIDPQLLRTDIDGLAKAMARRGIERSEIDALVELDERRRDTVSSLDSARAEQNVASKAIGTASPDERPAMIETASKLKAVVADLEDEAQKLEGAFGLLMAKLPNIAQEAAPDGDEGDGITLRHVGDKPEIADVRDHVDLMEAAGALDVKQAAKVSGARFAYLKADAVALEFALVRHALDIAGEHGHIPVIPPVLVREEALYGTGFFPGDEQSIFAMRDDDLYLVGTSEVALAGLHMDHIFDQGELPVRYAAFSSCFRREAGTYGKDTRGIFRVHQFDKVEMFAFVEPGQSNDEHERLLAIEEQIMQNLELHYRVVDIPLGDLGAPAARKFDIEAWLPGQQEYRELTSCSNTTDYQARRLKARMRSDDGTTTVHTLNGTATAVGRTIIAIVETHQQPDGTVRVPEKLIPYVGKDTLFAA